MFYVVGYGKGKNALLVGVVEALTAAEAAQKLGKEIVGDDSNIVGRWWLADGYHMREVLTLTAPIDQMIARAARVEVEISGFELTHTLEILPESVRLQITFRRCSGCDYCRAARATVEREIKKGQVGYAWYDVGPERWVSILRRHGEAPLDTLKRAFDRDFKFVLTTESSAESSEAA